MAMNTLLRSVLVAALLMAGCARDVGEQFVGKWVDVTSEKNVLSIEHNGESFIIRDTRPELFGNGVKTRNHPALLTKGVLQVSNGVGTVNYAIDEATGKLSTGDTEYTRVK
ncbi:lipoprotein, putative [Xanthomonas oryzae pv. oryzae PXO99A]|uniref:Lipoprotein, putative n=2 Tax=Xanthomonas oryzae TaxID=347 RepID=A0A0K0GPU2_XANOP|nr:lipoprotein, putative [Xanthomonas oryzae pv. oryzae PXO99A]